MLERRKNDRHFPVPRANHQRIVCGMAAGGSRGLRRTSSRSGRFHAETPRALIERAANKKGRREAGPSGELLSRSSVLCDDRAAPAIVDADGDKVGILVDALA